MTVQVDEAGGDIAAGGGDLGLAVPGHAADRDDPAVVDRHIGADPGVARAVEHAPVADHDVVFGRILDRRGSRPRQHSRDQHCCKTSHSCPSRLVIP